MIYPTSVISAFSSEKREPDIESADLDKTSACHCSSHPQLNIRETGRFFNLISGKNKYCCDVR